MGGVQTLMAKYEHSYVDVLKLACDGCEYEVLPEILKEAEVPIGQVRGASFRSLELELE